jgi:uncharacterized protein (DUF2141 family)|tara:strand:- start:17841 stop:18227 length:387 start_codon:yes stop_codon:yes gene_type:complete
MGAEGSGDLSIVVTNIEDHKGAIVLALHNVHDTYLSKDETKEPFRSSSTRVGPSQRTVVTLEQIPYGSYAVSVFHDVNSNGELDSGFFGIPKEPYGFSNNIKKLTPPSFQEATFVFADKSRGIEVALK